MAKKNQRVHVNLKGEIRACNASVRACEFENILQHYDSVEEAQAAYEHKMQDKTFNSVWAVRKQAIRKSAKRITKVAVIGGLSVSAAVFFLNGTTDIFHNGPDTHNTRAPGVNGPVAAPDKSNMGENTQHDKTFGESLRDWFNDSKEAVRNGTNNVIKDAENAAGYGGNTTNVSNPGSGAGSASDLPLTFQGKSIQPTKAEVDDALSRLNDIVVMPEKKVTGFDRTKTFGMNPESTYSATEMTDFQSNPNITFSKGSNPRAVDGTFIDPYTGVPTPISVNGQRTTNLEHIVALKEAAESDHFGTLDMKSDRDKSITNAYQIANDPINLTTVDGSVNKSKSDKDFHDWKPIKVDGNADSAASWDVRQCRFAIQVVTVKSEYGLTMDAKEHSDIKEVITNKCGV